MLGTLGMVCMGQRENVDIVPQCTQTESNHKVPEFDIIPLNLYHINLTECMLGMVSLMRVDHSVRI